MITINQKLSKLADMKSGYPDNCPNGHNPEKHDPEWTKFRMST